MNPPLSRIPLLGVTAAFAAGIIIAVGGAVCAWIAAAACCVAAVVMALTGRHYGTILCVATLLGAVDMLVHEPAEMPEQYGSSSHSWSAVVERSAERESGYAIDCRIDSIDHHALGQSFKVRIYYMSHEKVPKAGQQITFNAALRPLEFKPSVPDETDFTTFLRNKGIAATAIIAPDDITVCYPATGWDGLTERLRLNCLRTLFSLPLSNDTLSFLAATLLGDSSELPDDTREQFAAAGVAHMLALSGLHVAIIMIILNLMLFPLLLLRMRRAATVATIMALWGFALITGFSVSVVRAVIMATFVLSGRLLQREPSPINSLCAAALLILLLAPGALLEIGFQLSFSAVASIILLAEPLNPFRRSRTFLRQVGAYFGATIGAMLSAGILSVFYFHKFPVYFLIGNVLSAVFLPVLLGLAVVDICIGSIISLPQPLCYATDGVYDVMSWIASRISDLPGASIADIYIEPVALVPAGFTIAAFIAAVRMKRIFYWCACGTMAVILALVVWSGRHDYPSHEYFLTCDKAATSLLVRDGDSLYVVTTAPSTEVPTIIDNISLRFADYRGKRGLTRFSVAPDSVTGDFFVRRGNLMDLGGYRMALVTDDKHYPDSTAAVDIAVITKGFKGDIHRLCSAMKPDSVIIGADIHPRRAKRYADECRQCGVAVAVRSE